MTSSGGGGTRVRGEAEAGAGRGEARVSLARRVWAEVGGERRGRGPGAEIVLTRVAVWS